MSVEMSSTAETINGDQEVELIVHEASSSVADGVVSASEEITPLLIQSEKPKIDLFAVSYSRRKPREQVIKLSEAETSPLIKCLLWLWNGSRYSGLLCMALSSIIYFLMEVISDVFTVQSIPLFETTATRCTVVLILSYLWLRKSGQPIFGPPHARILLISRAVMGYFSLLSFIYCIQKLPLSQAIVLSFTTPIMASISASIISHEKMKIMDIGGLACSSFGLLFIFLHILTPQGVLVKAGEAVDSNVEGRHHVYAVLVGLLSSLTGGSTYCLIKAGAKASDQPVVTIFSFGILATPAAGICTFLFEEPVMPGVYSFFLTLLLGVFAFFAQVLMARGLQLEKISKVANMQYIAVVLSQLWGISTLKIAPSFGRLVGCFIILLSFCYTMYIGPEKETDEVPYSSVA